MATFRFDALGETPARLRSWFDRVRKGTSGRSAPARFAPLVVMAGCLAVAGYLAVWATATADYAYLASGQDLRQDDLAKLVRALQAQNVDYRVDGRRVKVPSKALESASAIVAKLDLGPRSPAELREGRAASSIWESPRDRDERAQRERARVIEALLDDLPGVEGSFVNINYERQRGVLRPSTRTTAFVQVATEQGGELPFSTVELIPSILSANEAGLSRNSITLMDREGRIYLDAGNPALTKSNSNRAREEDLCRRIADKLNWIRGVRVTVNLEELPFATTSAAESRRTVITTTPGMSVGLNRAMELEPEDDGLPPLETQAVAATPEPLRRRGEVWVLVPRSYYYHASLIPEGGQVSHEDQISLRLRTESQIREAVRLVLPQAEAVNWEPTLVDVYPDELPAQRLADGTIGASRRASRDWALAGAAGAAAASLVALGTWVLGGRQPVRRSSPARGGVRYHRGSPGTPAPTERVLEFVRRNPETAFSVLNRWTAQGGGRS